MGAILPHAKRALRSAITSLGDRRHYRRLRSVGGAFSADYLAYLEQQLERTLSKRSNDPGVGARLMVERVLELGNVPPGASVLCVGCRNTVELELFRRRGMGEVVGIDLFTQHPDVLVMDMHAMTFPDARFDVVYASHSLEHSKDLDVVLNEIARVARPDAVVAVEVPVGFASHPADRIEFGGVEELVARVLAYSDRLLWQDEQAPRMDANDRGTAVARVIFAPKRRADVSPRG